MSKTNNTTNNNRKQYHHLTKEKRAQIEILLHSKDINGKNLFNQSQIAKTVGVNKSTISRELKRIKAKINPRTGKIKVSLTMQKMLKMIIFLKELFLKLTTF